MKAWYMMEYGVYIWASYGIAFIGFGALFIKTWIDYRRIKQEHDL